VPTTEQKPQKRDLEMNTPKKSYVASFSCSFYKNDDVLIYALTTNSNGDTTSSWKLHRLDALRGEQEIDVPLDDAPMILRKWDFNATTELEALANRKREFLDTFCNREPLSAMVVSYQSLIEESSEIR